MSGANQTFGGNAPAWSQDERLWALWSISRPLLIAAAILGFILWWPIGFALLFLAIWNRRLGRVLFGGASFGAAGLCGFGGRSARWANGRSGWCNPGRRPSGNQAFDDYRAATLRRLEEEQDEFAKFLERLRFAKDKAEFDEFMAERRQQGSAPRPEEPPMPTT